MPSQDVLIQFLPLALIFIVFYFLLIRPQQKKQKEHQAKLSQIRRGDRILTQGGIYGLVTRNSDESKLEVEIASGVRVEIARSFVADVVSKTSTPDADNETTIEVKAEPAKRGRKKAN